MKTMASHLTLSVVLVVAFCTVVARSKEPTILFLGPNGVRPLTYGGGGGGDSGESRSGVGAVFSALPSTLGAMVTNFRDRDSEDRSNFIFRLGERFQERSSKQKGD